MSRQDLRCCYRYEVRVSRYRIYPTNEQESVLLWHCGHSRYVWNLAVEQHSWWHLGRGSAPGYPEQSRQLTAARAASPWLAAGSQTVQQQALRDFAHAMDSYFNGTHGRPTWRKRGVNEGFRVTGERGKHWDVRVLSRKWAEVRVPKAGWVRFRLSRPVPAEVKSYRVTRDRAGRWHVAFAHIPDPVPGPGDGKVVGVDRGVTVSAALSTGEKLHCPGLTAREKARKLKLERRLAKASRGSNRRARVKAKLSRLQAQEADRRRDWAEQTSTRLVRDFDLIRVEDLKIRNMTRSARGTRDKPGTNVEAKAGLNKAIHASGWGLLVKRLEEKAPGRVEKVRAAYTSQQCSACGHVDAKSRESQAHFTCTVCGYACNADVNAARNIAAGRVVKARGGDPAAGPVNRENQPLLL